MNPRHAPTSAAVVLVSVSPIVATAQRTYEITDDARPCFKWHVDRFFTPPDGCYADPAISPKAPRAARARPPDCVPSRR